MVNIFPYISDMGAIHYNDKSYTPLYNFINNNSSGLQLGSFSYLYNEPSGQYIYVPYATAEQLGVIKVGDNLSIDENGVLSANSITKISELENDASFITKTDSKTYTDNAIAALVDSAPDTLNTLNELATAITQNQDVITTLNDAIANKADKTTTEAFINYYDGVNTITSLTSVPTDKRLVVVSISADETITLDGSIDTGRELHIIINNTGSSDISASLTSSENYITITEFPITVKAGGYAEINVISDGNKYYFRSIWA